MNVVRLKYIVHNMMVRNIEHTFKVHVVKARAKGMKDEQPAKCMDGDGHKYITRVK